jgi:hypothetical protein
MGAGARPSGYKFRQLLAWLAGLWRSFTMAWLSSSPESLDPPVVMLNRGSWRTTDGTSRIDYNAIEKLRLPPRPIGPREDQPRGLLSKLLTYGEILPSFKRASRTGCKSHQLLHIFNSATFLELIETRPTGARPSSIESDSKSASRRSRTADETATPSMSWLIAALSATTCIPTSTAARRLSPVSSSCR